MNNRIVIFCAVSTSKRYGVGKANWDRVGDEALDAPIDKNDPSYDSADD